MAKKREGKIMMESFMTSDSMEEGKRTCAVVKLRGSSEFGKKHGVPIGRVCRVDGGYTHSIVSSGGRTHTKPFKTQAGAIRGLVKSYKQWIGG